MAHGLPEIMSATVLPAIIFPIMLRVDWRLALVMIVGMPLMWITKRISAPIWAKNFKMFADSTTYMQENVMEYVSNISVIKAFGKTETKTEKAIQSAKDYDYWVKKIHVRALRSDGVDYSVYGIGRCSCDDTRHISSFYRSN